MKIADFFSQKSSVTFAKGQAILEAHADHLDVHYIEKGHIRVYRLSPNGSEKIYVFLRPSEMFPITWAFNDINKHLIYEAMDNVTIKKTSRDEFMQFLAGKPEVLQEVIHRIVDIYNIYIDRVDNLGYTNSYQRVIVRLLALAKRFGEKKENSVLINLPITQSDIANTVAMTRETASRELEVLKKKGLLKYYGHLIVLTDTNKLQQELLTTIK